jgi:peptide deformylase
MALRKVTIEGDEALRKTCKEITNINARIKLLADDMLETMKKESGVGLAAPQVGVLRRMFVAEPEPGELYVMVNPVITEEEGTQESTEGCLSVPGFIGLVDRPMSVKLEAQDIEGIKHNYEFTGFHAVVMCHELDHLNGMLYIDRSKQTMTNEEYEDMLLDSEINEEVDI